MNNKITREEFEKYLKVLNLDLYYYQKEFLFKALNCENDICMYRRLDGNHLMAKLYSDFVCEVAKEKQNNKEK